MAALTYDALHRALKRGELERAYYVVGEEEVLKEDVVRLVADRAVEPSLRDFNYDVRSGPALEPEALHALCNTLPMMSERRMVVLRDVEGWQKKARGRAAVLRYLEHPAPETVLVLVQGSGEPDPDAELARHATVVACEPLAPERAAKWAVHEASRAGLALPPEAAAHLVNAVGAGLSVLRAEVAKLTALPEGTPITLELVGDLVGVRHGETVVDWRDAVMDDRTGDAARLVPRVLAQAGVSGVKLVTLLGTTLVGTSLARALLDRGQRGRTLEEGLFRTLLRLKPWGLGDWKVETRQWARWAEGWPEARLRRALREVLAADQALKGTTLGDEDAILLDLVLRLGRLERRKAS